MAAKTQQDKCSVASILSTVATTVAIGLLFFSPKVTHGGQNSPIDDFKSMKQECSATAQPCFLGIDPDIYAMS